MTTVFLGRTHYQYTYVLWNYPTLGPVTSSPAVSPDGATVYVGDDDGGGTGGGNLKAIDTASGTMNWFNSNCSPTCSPAVPPLLIPPSDVLVYTTSKSSPTDQAVNAITGPTDELWHSPWTATSSSSPIVSADGVSICVGDSTGSLRVLSHSGTAPITIPLGGGQPAAPAISPDSTWVAIGNAAGASSKYTFWTIVGGGTAGGPSISSGADILSTPTFSPDGNTLYLILDNSIAGTLLIANTVAGTAGSITLTSIWAFTVALPSFGGAGPSSPTLSPDGATVYVGSNDHKLYAVNAATGIEKWSYQTGDEIWSTPAVALDGTIYVGSNDWKLYAINADGTLKWSYKTGGAVKSSPAISSDGTIIYVGSDDYNLYALGGPFPIADPKTRCCYTSKHRNPLRAPRKELDCSNYKVAYNPYTGEYTSVDACPKKPFNTIYKDNYAVSCTSCDPSINAVCYNPVIRRVQNRNGYINDQYNYSAKQYLNRRCRTYEQQALNFNASLAMDASCCKNKFATQCYPHPVPVDASECIVDCSNCETVACRGYSNCAAKNANCCSIYKRSNAPFRRQGAVSGGSRINRLKYQTVLKSQSTYKVPNPNNPPRNNKQNAYRTVNTCGNINATNGMMPVMLYRDTLPQYKNNLSDMCFQNCTQRAWPRQKPPKSVAGLRYHRQLCRFPAHMRGKPHCVG